MTNLTHPLPNPFRTRLLHNQITSVLTLKHILSNEIALMAKTANIDALLIDLEHSPQTLHTASQLILASLYVGISPLVRVPSKSHWHISRALDAGAAAVIVPHCETVEEVRQIVREGKFPPLGRRGCANNQPLLGFQHVPTEIQNDVLNRETMVIPMVETASAVELVDQFLAVDGVDGVLVGSNDLCTDLGIPGQYDNQIYQDAVTRVVEAGVKAKKPVGIGGIGGRLDLLEMWFRMGATWSLSGADGAILQAGMKGLGKTYREINHRVQRQRQTVGVDEDEAVSSNGNGVESGNMNSSTFVGGEKRLHGVAVQVKEVYENGSEVHKLNGLK